MSLPLYSENTSTVDKKRKNKPLNKSQYMSQEIPDSGDFSLVQAEEVEMGNNIVQAEEVKLGNTIFIVLREYSKTTDVTLKQRLEQIIHDRVSEMKFT